MEQHAHDVHMDVKFVRVLVPIPIQWFVLVVKTASTKKETNAKNVIQHVRHALIQVQCDATYAKKDITSLKKWTIHIFMQENAGSVKKAQRIVQNAHQNVLMTI